MIDEIGCGSRGSDFRGSVRKLCWKLLILLAEVNVAEVTPTGGLF